jgi:hypothetical protein
MKLYIGMPESSQMPQQVLLPPQEIRPQPEMVIDVLGIRVPAEMLNSPAFWAFLIIAAITVLGVAWLKYRSAAK